jgi:D-sedoheptulose 7-phosphate isomerase
MPQNYINSCSNYFSEYRVKLELAYASIDLVALDKAAEMLVTAHETDKSIFSCGNGGSAAISNHLACDHQKGVATNTRLRPKVVSLSSNVEIITAIGNDYGFGQIFSHSLNLHARAGDLLIAISSSGKSENIIQAVSKAKELGLKVIALTGFDGGDAKNLADISLHVNSKNYGVVEDVHQTLMHVLAQYIRSANVPSQLLEKIQF